MPSVGYITDPRFYCNKRTLDKLLAFSELVRTTNGTRSAGYKFKLISTQNNTLPTNLTDT